MPIMPLAISSEEWSRITKWTKQFGDNQDAIRRREYVKLLDDKSKEMRKKWPNSYENVNKRNEELRQARVRAAEEANMNFYKKYVKRKQDEQKRMMQNARDEIFKNKDAPKLLLSAVLETAVQKEREEQVKFVQQRRREALELAMREDRELVTKAAVWEREQRAKRSRRELVNKEHQKDIILQARELFEKNRQEHEDELTMQKTDNVKADQQIELIAKLDKEFKEETKSRIRHDMEVARAQTEDRRRQQKHRSDVDDRLIHVLVQSRCRVENKRKETEKQLQKERLRIVENISKKLESGDAAREQREQKMRDDAVREKDEIAAKKEFAEKEKVSRLRAARVEERERHLLHQERQLQGEHAIRNWEIMNRLKNDEINKLFNDQITQERQRKIKEHRDFLIKQWKERDDAIAQEVSDRRHFYGTLVSAGVREQDRQLLQLATALVQEATELGRPTHALHRTIQQYCKMHRLYPMPDLPASMKEHFPQYKPTDGTQFDSPKISDEDLERDKKRENKDMLPPISGDSRRSGRGVRK